MEDFCRLMTQKMKENQENLKLFFSKHSINLKLRFLWSENFKLKHPRKNFLRSLFIRKMMNSSEEEESA